MFEDLDHRRIEGFRGLAATYAVTHTVGVGYPECERLMANKGMLQLMYRLGSVCVLRLKP